MNPYVIDKYVLNLDNIAFIEKKEHSIVVVFCATRGDGLLSKEFRGESADVLWQRFSGSAADAPPSAQDEELYEKCIYIMRQERQCSTYLLQRQLRMSDAQTKKMFDLLEGRGIVGPGYDPQDRRTILVDLEAM